MELSFKRAKRTSSADELSKIPGLEAALKLPLLGGDIDDSIVEVVDNNIYFYTEVSTTSCYQLIKALRKLDIKYQEKAIREGVENVNINLHIHSGGGDLFAAFAVIDVIRTMQTPVHSYIEGMAASAATIISVVCERRFMYKHSYMLIHQLSAGMWGKFSEMKDEFKSCKDMMTDIKKIYVEHTNLKKRELKEILTHDLWWNSSVCLANGLVDEVL